MSEDQAREHVGEEGLEVDSLEDGVRESIATSAIIRKPASSATSSTTRWSVTTAAMAPAHEKASATGSAGRLRAIPKCVSESDRINAPATTTKPITEESGSRRPPARLPQLPGYPRRG